MTTRPHSAAVGLVLFLSTIAIGCRGPAPVGRPTTTTAVAPAAATHVRTELYFGLARKGAPNVTDEQWRSFVDTEVTPRFPAGLTVLSAAGQWRGEDGAIVREPSRVLVLFYEPSAEAERHVEAIRAAYCQRFQQEAVMRADSVERVRF